MAQNWFKHDYSARNDEKILELRAEYGWHGYGLFFALVESMCETETGCIDIDRIGGLSVGYGLPKEELLTFINFCLDIDLFYEDEDGLIRNGRVIEHLELMDTLKEAGRKGANKRWGQQSDGGGNGEGSSPPNADEIRQDEIRQDNTREDEPFKSNVRIVDYLSDHDLSEVEDKNIVLACHIWKAVDSLQPNNKTTQRAKLKTWVEPVRLMVDQDERTHEEIWALWKKIKADSFWHNKILSTSTLRKKYDRLSINLKNSKPQNNGINEGKLNEQLANLYSQP